MGSNLRRRISISTSKRLGSMYFLLLGLVNLVATFIYAEVRTIDLIIALVCVLPLLIRKKMFLLLFGIVAAFISVYLTLAGFSFFIDPQVQTSSIAFFMGFLLTGSALLSSLLLVYSGGSNERLPASPGTPSR